MSNDVGVYLLSSGHDRKDYEMMKKYHFCINNTEDKKWHYGFHPFIVRSYRQGIDKMYTILIIDKGYKEIIKSTNGINDVPDVRQVYYEQEPTKERKIIAVLIYLNRQYNTNLSLSIEQFEELGLKK